MSFFRLRYFFRQKKRIFALTFFLVIIFLMYQLFSVGQLGEELNRRRTRPRLQTNFRSYEKADGFMQSRTAEKEVKDDVSHGKSVPQEITNFVVGVLPSSQVFYKPTPRNTFRCLQSGEEIKYAFVNDNFCDCSDYSDEPSTSACNDGRFHCTYQSKKQTRSVPSYKVNDGICDCCDGSDEWLRIKLPDHTLVAANKQKGIFQVPCPMRCVS